MIPFKIRKSLFIIFFILESRDKETKNGLKRIFSIKDKIEWIINERAIVYGDGIHPKHRLTNYHKFFIDNIKNGDSVIDVGCGNGAVAIDVALAKPKSIIYGVDINKENIIIAERLRKLNSLNNIKFIFGDIFFQKNLKSDVIILSNVLEHIEKRTAFLKQLISSTGATKFLIRVPLFERDWQMALKRELSIYYYSDLDHKIEHTFKELKSELSKSGLKIKEFKSIWGEIWTVCEYAK